MMRHTLGAAVVAAFGGMALVGAEALALQPPPESPPQAPAKPAEQPAGSPLDAIIAPGVEAEPIATDGAFQFLEGPVWVPGEGGQGGRLLFTDIPADTIYQWTPPAAGDDEPAGRLEVWLSPSRHANGLMIDAQRRLVVCEHERRLVRFDSLKPPGADAVPTVLAESFEGKRLNSPNDLDIAPDGSIYFTDPPYGLNKVLGKEGEKELDFHGVFRITPAGELSLLTRDLRSPNGLAFSPDHKRLYIADMGRSELRVFDVKPDGTIENNRLLAELKTDAGRGAGGDGVRTDTRGHIYVAARGGVWVFDPQGNRLGVIPVPQGPANLCFGGDDMRTMFITAQRGLYRLPVKIPGNR